MARPDGAYATLVKLQAIVHQKDLEVSRSTPQRRVSCKCIIATASGAWPPSASDVQVGLLALPVLAKLSAQTSRLL